MCTLTAMQIEQAIVIPSESGTVAALQRGNEVDLQVEICSRHPPYRSIGLKISGHIDSYIACHSYQYHDQNCFSSPSCICPKTTEALTEGQRDCVETVVAVQRYPPRVIAVGAL